MSYDRHETRRRAYPYSGPRDPRSIRYGQEDSYKLPLTSEAIRDNTIDLWFCDRWTNHSEL
jgi:hypothetical protein